jgi:putative OPT family oligopeptide transporter
MFAGLLIAWAGAVPILTAAHPAAVGIDPEAHMMAIWKHQVRFIGAGAIGVSAIWTLAKLAKPVVGGLVSAISSSRATGPRNDLDRDLQPKWIIALTVACLVVAGALSFTFAKSTTLAPHATMLTAIAVPFVFIVGFLIAGVCGYMAGLIGASNSPISGVGILAIVTCASVLSAVLQPAEDLRPVLVAFALFVTAIVFACATISNDNLQDLKTGQLVGAAPWRQQVALIVGVAAGAAVIPSVLNLLSKAYGFAGAPVVGQKPLAAPQATLISALAQGVIGGNLDWGMIGIGALVGAGLIVVDSLLKLSKRMSLPPLAVGIGIYLPMSATFAVVVGAIIGHVYNKWAEKTSAPGHAERLGTLIASGLIVGESLFGVLNAGLIVGLKNDNPLGLVPATFPPANLLGMLGFIVLIVCLYGWMVKKAR